MSKRAALERFPHTPGRWWHICRYISAQLMACGAVGFIEAGGALLGAWIEDNAPEGQKSFSTCSVEVLVEAWEELAKEQEGVHRGIDAHFKLVIEEWEKAA